VSTLDGIAPAGRVLVVDADPDARAAARKALEGARFLVDEAADAESARSATTPDIVVIDPVLPDGGDDLISGARAPVIVSSGFDGYERRSLDRGARIFLRKPADPDELVRAVVAARSGEAALISELAAENRARTGRLRADAADTRERLLAGAPLDADSLRGQLRALTAWASGYFGVRRAFVLVLERGQLRVLAESGGAPTFPDGVTTDPVVHFDNEVVTAGAPLVVSDAPSHAVFARHPAAAITTFYAGAPLLTAGRIALGTFCVEDVSPTPFHAEDAALLRALGRMTGRLIESIAHGGPPAPTLFAAPAVFAPETLDALLSVELSRTARGRSAMELALVTLRGELSEALGDIAHDVARVGRRRFALATVGSRLAIVCGDVTRDLVRRRVDQAIAAFAWRHPVTAAGAASIDPAAGSAPSAASLSPKQVRAAAHDMLELASRSPGGCMQRIALA